MKLTYRYQALFTIESATPISVGSGESGLLTDRLIVRDANGLPMIPGTSLAGVLRNELGRGWEESRLNDLFGFQGDSEGRGSRLVVSSAHLMGPDGNVVEGLLHLEERLGVDFHPNRPDGNVVEGLLHPSELENNPYFNLLQQLPERDHVRIDDRGVAADKAKYDEEVLHKGVRFVFGLELIGGEKDRTVWQETLSTFFQPMFRIGGGTRKGFGAIEVVNCFQRMLDLENEKGLGAYLEDSSSLNQDTSTGWEVFKPNTLETKGWKQYRLKLEPESFFLMGAGFGNENADAAPKMEGYFHWESGQPELLDREAFLLIPASSIKGALAHRTAFHFNRLTDTYITGSAAREPEVPSVEVENLKQDFDWPVDPESMKQLDSEFAFLEARRKVRGLDLEGQFSNLPSWKQFQDDLEEFVDAEEDMAAHGLPIGEGNEAVRTLFGYARDEEEGARGRVILDDLYLPNQTKNHKVFSHVSIDRFTGGGRDRDGALFQQEVVTAEGFFLSIWVEETALEDQDVRQAFEAALEDLASGRLPIGGSTTKGHGALQGELKK